MLRSPTTHTASPWIAIHGSNSRRSPTGRFARVPSCIVRSALVVCVWILPACRPAEPAQEPTTNDYRRVVTMSPSTAEIIFALGADDRLVGVSRFCTYPPEAQQLPTIGGQRDPNLERIVGLHPDLLILRGHNDVVEKLCRELAIPVYHDPTNTLDDLFVTIGELGRMLQRQSQAEELIDSMRRSLDDVRQRVRRHDPVRVLFVVSRSPDRLANVFVVGGESYLASLIEIAGGVGVFNDSAMDYLEVSPEAILSVRPEVIIDAMPGQVLDSAQRATLVAHWKTLGSIPAVRNGRVIIVTDNYVTIPSPRIAVLAQDLAGWLHGEEGP